MIQQMLATWSLVPPPLLTSLTIWKFSVHVLLDSTFLELKPPSPLQHMASKAQQIQQSCLSKELTSRVTLHTFPLWPRRECESLPEKAMAPHSSTLAWKIPWTEEPGGLQSMGSLRVGHDWVTLLSLFTFMHWRRKWQPTPVFLPGESQGRRSLVGCRLWGRTESDTTERLSSSRSSSSTADTCSHCHV